MDDNVQTKTESEEEQVSLDQAEQKDEEAAEDTGPIKCSECTQVYSGPASLKRHLWRIHRMAGDDAQVVVDACVETAAKEREATLKEEEPEEKQDTDNSVTNNKKVKPLLEVPLVRPLLDITPEPPGFQANNFGGVSPTPTWSNRRPPTVTPVSQPGLLPTPGCQDSMPPGFVAKNEESQTSDDSAPTESGDGKIKPLMELNPLGDQQGIPSLMSLPVMGRTPYMYSGGMGGGGYYSRYRRRERRNKPYNKERNNMSGDQNGGQHDNAAPDDQGGQCGECGEEFIDSADLDDHELTTHQSSIDLTCDVELTA